MPLRSRRPPLTFGVYEGERGDVPAPIKLFAGGFSGLLVEIDDFEHVSSRPWGRNSYPTLFVSLEWLFPLRRSIDSHRGFWQRRGTKARSYWRYSSLAPAPDPTTAGDGSRATGGSRVVPKRFNSSANW